MVQWRYRRTLELYKQCKIKYPNYLSPDPRNIDAIAAGTVVPTATRTFVPMAAQSDVPMAAQSEGLVTAMQNGDAAPSEGVPPASGNLDH